eukprot:GEMP01045277.1.p1 GENE.GEMP01045277.1~~GEMP01045277.1.p1  ORF type:complete len:296 (+),score=36.02 GEMP01045277.1:125-889(+)
MQQVTIVRDHITNHKFGNFHHNDMLGKEYGSRIISRGSDKGWTTVVRPTPEMITLSLPHRTQIIYHADISLITALLDVHPGSRIVEAGTGSGSLSCSIAHCVRPSGRLFTFEFHEERHQQALTMFANNGYADVISSFHGNACEEGFVDKVPEPVDGVFLDLPTPWAALKNARAVLKELGRVCTFSPCVEQVQKTVTMMRAENFTDVRTFECLSKPWHLQHGKKRNREGMMQMNMRGHTSYITVATVPLNDEDSL